MANRPAITDASLAAQLRSYGDAIDAQLLGAASSVAPSNNGAQAPLVGLPDRNDHNQGRRSRRAGLLAVAAVALLATTGVGTWLVVRDQGEAIETGPVGSIEDGESDPTVDAGPDDNEPGTRPLLLPDEAEWAVVEVTTDPAAAVDRELGVWAWEDERGLFILITSPSGGSGEPPQAEAAVETMNERVSMVWGDGRARVSFQGIGASEQDLRAAATSLRRDGENWVLDGATVLAAEPTPPPVDQADHLQIQLAPADDLVTHWGTVSSSSRPGSVGSLYAELHEASGVGTLTERTIAGRRGYLIKGDDFALALVAHNGWVTTWQTSDPEVDLAGLLDSVEQRSSSEWDDAVAAGEQARVEAIAAAAERGDTGDGWYVADLPRYVLPEPWELDWVTDLGIWTLEQRAQRDALAEANTPAAVSHAVWTQGFRHEDSDAAVPAPDILVAVTEYLDRPPEGGGWLDAAANTAEPYPLAGLEGHLIDNGGTGQWYLVASDEQYEVMIQTRPGMTAREVRAFADSLEVRPEGLARGFTSSGPYVVGFDLAGQPGGAAGQVTNWLASWTRPGGRASVKVEELTMAELQWQLFLSAGLPGTSFEVVDGDAQLLTFMTRRDQEALNELADHSTDPVESAVTTYDPATGLMVEVSTTVRGEDARDLLDRLVEVDLDTWRERVEPVNADPLHPR